MCGNKYNIYLQIYKQIYAVRMRQFTRLCLPLSLQMCTHSRPHMPVCKFQCVLLLHCRLTCIYRTPLSAAHSYITLAAFPKRLMPFSSCQYMWISTMCSLWACRAFVENALDLPFYCTHFSKPFFLQFKSAKQLLQIHTRIHTYVYIYINLYAHTVT